VGLHAEHQAGPDRLAVEQDRARAAHALLAPDVGPGVAKVVAEHVDQGSARLHPDVGRGAGGPWRDVLAVAHEGPPTATPARLSRRAASTRSGVMGIASISTPR